MKATSMPHVPAPTEVGSASTEGASASTARRGFLQGALCAAATLSVPALAKAAPLARASDDARRAIDPDRPGASCRTKFAVNIEMWGFGVPALHERVRKVADLGFGAVEFWPWRGRDLDALGKACKDAKIEIMQFTAWGFTPGMNDPKNHDDVVKEIAASCEVAKRLGAPMMTVVAGNDIPGMSQEQMHANVIEALKRCAPVAEKAGVTLILEPMNIRVDHKGHCLYGSAPAIAICKAVGSPFVKINWDLYHMHISEGDLCGHMREGFEHVGYFQLADHPGRNEPGTGEIHYNRVLKEAWNLGYRGGVGLECSPLEGELQAARRVAAADIW